MTRLEQCPKCKAQIVLYDWGFKCSMCDYDLKDWVEDLAQDVLEKSDIAVHEMVADSPALAFDYDDFEARR